MSNYPSRWIESAVEEISRLPGIGKKSALRIVLHLLKKDKSQSAALSKSIAELRENIRYCIDCGNISDSEKCHICASHLRDRTLMCVVEDTRDVMAIENTGQYKGLYHVLGGVISPLEGIGPEELGIDRFIKRVESMKDEIGEIIFALSPTMEGDTTTFYITKKIGDSKIKTSSIARGIPVGGELEYADEITLGRSILSRVKYDETNN